MLSGPLEVRCYHPDDMARVRTEVEDSLEHLRPTMDFVDDWPLDEPGLLEILLGFRGRFDLAQDFVYGVFARGPGHLVGGCGLHPRVGDGGIEIGYWVGRRHLRRGVASAVVRMLTQAAFRFLSVERTEIHILPDNRASLGVPEPQGYVREGLRRRRFASRGEWFDTIAFTMVEEEFVHSPCATPIDNYDAADRPLPPLGPS
jgi:RimJ/RimL family protein N-acetyltransferase